MSDHGLRAGLDAPARAFTKADIDALFNGASLLSPTGAYLAAGLTADGQPKQVRCWIGYDGLGTAYWFPETSISVSSWVRVVHGTFIPDEAAP